jgi:hypothetical protein
LISAWEKFLAIYFVLLERAALAQKLFYAWAVFPDLGAERLPLFPGQFVWPNRDNTRPPDGNGFAVFELIRRQRHGGAAVLCAFDLIELEGEDLRRAAIEHRKQKLSRLVRTPHPGIILNEHYDGDGEIVFKYACKLGCEGIVSKRLGSPYRSGRFAHWVKVKNPNVPAVKREADEGWGDNQ